MASPCFMAVAGRNGCLQTLHLSSLLWPNRVDIEVEQIGSWQPGLHVYTYLHRCHNVILHAYLCASQHHDVHQAGMGGLQDHCLCTILYESYKLTLADIASRKLLLGSLQELLSLSVQG